MAENPENPENPEHQENLENPENQENLENLVGDDQYMRMAVTAATDSIGEGGGPFGAVLVTASGRVYTGTDQVLTTNDPTAHAEVMAIRAASEGEQNYDLSGSVLYSSCQPCPMCLTAALWARIPRVVYAATAQQAAEAGFDDASFYRQLEGGLETVTDADLTHIDLPNANQPFETWDQFEGKVDF